MSSPGISSRLLLCKTEFEKIVYSLWARFIANLFTLRLPTLLVSQSFFSGMSKLFPLRISAREPNQRIRPIKRSAFTSLSSISGIAFLLSFVCVSQFNHFILRPNSDPIAPLLVSVRSRPPSVVVALECCRHPSSPAAARTASARSDCRRRWPGAAVAAQWRPLVAAAAR